MQHKKGEHNKPSVHGSLLTSHLFPALPWVPPGDLVTEHGRVGLRPPLELGLVHDELAHVGKASRFRDDLSR